MSAQLDTSSVLWAQRLYACEGFYDGDLDGLHGPKTDAARTLAEAESDRLAALYGRFDPRTERVLDSCLTSMQRYARGMLRQWRHLGLDARLISGTRTYPEQAALYAQGRTAPGEIVTNAKPGESFHNLGSAVDLGLFRADGSYIRKDVAPYEDAAFMVRDYCEGSFAPIVWGGHFRSFKDRPHYQLNLGVRARDAAPWFERGNLYGCLGAARAA